MLEELVSRGLLNLSTQMWHAQAQIPSPLTSSRYNKSYWTMVDVNEVRCNP